MTPAVRIKRAIVQDSRGSGELQRFLTNQKQTYLPQGLHRSSSLRSTRTFCESGSYTNFKVGFWGERSAGAQSKHGGWRTPPPCSCSPSLPCWSGRVPSFFVVVVFKHVFLFFPFSPFSFSFFGKCFRSSPSLPPCSQRAPSSACPLLPRAPASPVAELPVFLAATEEMPVARLVCVLGS